MRATLLVVAVTLMLLATGAGYVRRSAPPQKRAAVVEVSPAGSRDRTLHGKARVRARRHPPVS